MFRSVFEFLIQNHFPAPGRSYVTDMQKTNESNEGPSRANAKRTRTKVQKSPSPARERNAELKRKVLADLDFRVKKTKKPRVVYSDESDEENETTMASTGVVKMEEEKPVIDSSIKTKGAIINLDSDEENDVNMNQVKSEMKNEKVNLKKRKMDSESEESSVSDEDDDFSGMIFECISYIYFLWCPEMQLIKKIYKHIIIKNISQFHLDERSSSDSDSDSDSEYNDSHSDSDTPYESDASIANSDVTDESSEYDSDLGMEVMAGRSRVGSGKGKTMQEKIHLVLLDQQRNNNGQTGLNALQISYCNRACDLKEILMGKVEQLGKQLPPNTLDQLIDELGGPSKVAELTGRKGRVVQNEDDEIQYESRAEEGINLDQMNLLEKQRFMDGDKLVAIISEAASNGISLQSDRRVTNNRRRVHITLELPWSADKAIQQFGRTHRSNQVNAPEYIFLISNLAGERRFASSVAKRLESLGALTHADRRATETRNLSQFNVETKYGREALHTILKNVLLPDPDMKKTYDKEKIELFSQISIALAGVGIGVGIDPIANVEMSRFLNRILGMPIDLQNKLFEYFCETLDEIIAREKRTGKYDMGILGKSFKILKNCIDNF